MVLPVICLILALTLALWAIATKCSSKRHQEFGWAERRRVAASKLLIVMGLFSLWFFYLALPPDRDLYGSMQVKLVWWEIGVVLVILFLCIRAGSIQAVRRARAEYGTPNYYVVGDVAHIAYVHDGGRPVAGWCGRPLENGRYCTPREAHAAKLTVCTDCLDRVADELGETTCRMNI